MSDDLLNAVFDPERVTTADSLEMDAIHVRSTRIEEPLRYQPVDVQRIDSTAMELYRSGSVSEVLSRYSSLHIQDNGPGGLATLSQRGLSASQTQVLWEGFPINTPSLGLSDLSVIPAGLFGSAEVSPGTPSSAFGGGSLGGTVFLSADAGRRENRLTAGQTAGAFGTYASHLQAVRSGDRLTATIRGSYRTAQNDFDYYNPATDRTESRQHNAGRSGHLTGSIDYQRERTRYYSRLWLHDNFDEIPGTILAGNPQAEQTLRGGRWIGGVETRLSGWRVDASAFLDEDRFTYDDPPTDIESRFRRGRALLDIDLKRPSAGRMLWKGGVSGGREYVRTGNYFDDRQRTIFSGRLSPEFRLANRRLRLTPTLRLDHYSDFGLVASPSLGANWEVLPNRLHLRGQVSRDFNPPSFNDLYWQPGGNPDLKPEHSWKTEAGVAYLPESDVVESIRLTGYRIRLDEGIYWFPVEGGNWSPSNVEKVDAHGAEALAQMRWAVGRTRIGWNLAGEWRRAVIARERFDGDRGVGRQMRYVPEFSARSDLSVDLSPWTFRLDYRWTGRRFTTEDHTSSLDPFQIVDVSARFSQSLLGADWSLRLSVRNLLDETHQIVRWYPMPGRHVEASLSLTLF